MNNNPKKWLLHLELINIERRLLLLSEEHLRLRLPCRAAGGETGAASHGQEQTAARQGQRQCGQNAGHLIAGGARKTHQRTMLLLL